MAKASAKPAPTKVKAPPFVAKGKTAAGRTGSVAVSQPPKKGGKAPPFAKGGKPAPDFRGVKNGKKC